MSRIGRTPIQIPSGAQVEVKDFMLSVRGPLGILERKIPDGIDVEISNGMVYIRRKSESKRHRSLHGLCRTLAANMILGVTKGFQKELQIVGVGYRAEKKGKRVVFSLGYSHPIVLALPEGISIDVPAQDSLVVKGINKELVGNLAAKIRAFRPPEPYKGKGVQYRGEQIRRKVGKAAV